MTKQQLTMPLMAVLLASALAASSASAQSPSADLLGGWSGQRPGQGGMDHYADLFRPDGSMVSVLQLPNGTVERMWGHYRATPMGQGQVHVDVRVEGYLPRENCAQAPGFPVRCGPNRLPATFSNTVTFTSANSLVMNGNTEQRDRSPYLLSLSVPERYVLAARAPVQPSIRQPVNPGGARYQTPNGPGLGMSAAGHQGAKNFEGYMKGCTRQDASGTWVDCQQ